MMSETMGMVHESMYFGLPFLNRRWTMPLQRALVSWMHNLVSWDAKIYYVYITELCYDEMR